MALTHTDMAGTHTQDVDPVTGRDRPSTSLPGGAPTTASHLRLDLKALRMAVHGWWLGNPLAYKPGVPDLLAVTRALAAAGAASGTIVVSDAPAAAGSSPADGGPPSPASSPDRVEAVLILRPPLPLPQPSGTLAQAVLQAVAESAWAVLDPTSSRSCAIRWPSEVVVHRPADGEPVAPLCSVEVEQHAGIAYVGLRFALDQLPLVGVATCDSEGQRPGTGMEFFARSDWREVFLARVLHTLEGHLRKLP